MTKRLIIGVVGAPSSGVTLVSKRLASHHNFLRIRFGDAITRMLIAGFGISADQIDGPDRRKPLADFGGISGAQLKVTLGFDWGRRKVHNDLWLVPWCRAISSTSKSIATDDLRFPNDADAIRRVGGFIWRVRRPGRDEDDVAAERQRKLIPADLTLLNDSTPDVLLKRTDEALFALLGRPLLEEAVA